MGFGASFKKVGIRIYCEAILSVFVYFVFCFCTLALMYLTCARLLNNYVCTLAVVFNNMLSCSNAHTCCL